MKNVIHKTRGFIGYLAGEFEEEWIVRDPFDEDKFIQVPACECSIMKTKPHAKSDNIKEPRNGKL